LCGARRASGQQLRHGFIDLDYWSELKPQFQDHAVHSIVEAADSLTPTAGDDYCRNAADWISAPALIRMLFLGVGVVTLKIRYLSRVMVG
jgi:hypothetical protein